MDTNGNAATATSSVFDLYQKGLTPNQVLQLCFLRRRAPLRLRLGRVRIEDEFVLPRPELKVASLFPPAHISLEQLVQFDSPAPQISRDVADHSLEDAAFDQIRESARAHFLHPRQAERKVIERWGALAESDWVDIYQSVQLGQDDEMNSLSALQAPDIGDVCWMLEHCRSDAFASFVWDHLLLSLLQQCVGSDSSMHQRLFTLLVSSHALASISPKDFRAKVRSRNLRQVDGIFGAKAELALIGIYRRQRDAQSERFP